MVPRILVVDTDYQAQNRAIALAAETQKQHLQEALKSLQQAQSHLVQSEKMSSLGQLVAGVAHEINNPVNFIAGNVTYAASYTQELIQLVKLYQQHFPNPPEEIAAYLDEIDFEFLEQDYQRMFQSMQTGTERIRDIVTSLRNFSRLDQAEIKPVDIHEGIESTLMILDHRLKPYGKNLGIEVQRFYGDLPLVECFAGQLNQVFMNLLSNAIDAVEAIEGDRQIQITTSTLKSAPHLLEDDRVQVSIRDNGIGMSKTTQDNIFNPFFTTKPPGKGTGLGLSISYKIVVERHQGQLRCYSQPYQGTQFLLDIPIHHPLILYP